MSFEKLCIAWTMMILPFYLIAENLVELHFEFKWQITYTHIYMEYSVMFWCINTSQRKSVILLNIANITTIHIFRTIKINLINFEIYNVFLSLHFHYTTESYSFYKVKNLYALNTGLCFLYSCPLSYSNHMIIFSLFDRNVSQFFI